MFVFFIIIHKWGFFLLPNNRQKSYDINNPGKKVDTRHATGVLKAWLREHRKSPYPSKQEKIMFTQITKMTMTQVCTWFANARRRMKKENSEEGGSSDNNSDSAGSGDEDDDGDGEDSRTDTSSQDSRKSIPSEFDLQLSIIVFKHVLDSYLSAAPKFTPVFSGFIVLKL